MAAALRPSFNLSGGNGFYDSRNAIASMKNKNKKIPFHAATPSAVLISFPSSLMNFPLKALTYSYRAGIPIFGFYLILLRYSNASLDT